MAKMLKILCKFSDLKGKFSIEKIITIFPKTYTRLIYLFFKLYKKIEPSYQGFLRNIKQNVTAFEAVFDYNDLTFLPISSKCLNLFLNFAAHRECMVETFIKTVKILRKSIQSS